MNKHTWRVIFIAFAVVACMMGSMRTVKAVDASQLFISAGAARAFGVPAATMQSGSSTKGSTEQQESEHSSTSEDVVDIVITTEPTGGAGSTNTGTIENATKSGEVAGIAYDKLVMANVQEAVNVREEPSENATIVGKFYNDCGGEMIDSSNGWTKVSSGALTGWIRNDFLLFGDSAVALAEKSVEKTATCTTDCLRVRKTADPNGTVLTLLATGETIAALDTEGEWVKVEFSDGDIGYVSAEYVTISYELGKGDTMEAIAAKEEAEKKEREEAEAAAKRAEVEANRTTQTTLTNTGAVTALSGDIDDVRLLAALIQCEGGGQPYEGQVSIGTVVINRLKMGRYGNTIYSVIYAKSQFGPAGTGAVAKVYAAGPKASCMQAAQDAINGVSYIGTATHFRNIRSGYTGIVIGDHVFW